MLGATRSRSQLDQIGIDSESICKYTEDASAYLCKLEDLEIEADSIVHERINRIKKKETDLKFLEAKLSRHKGIWEGHHIEGCKTDIDDLQENVHSLKQLLNDDATIHNSKRSKWLIVVGVT